MKLEEAYPGLKEIEARVPQGSVLKPVLYLLLTCYLPQLENNTIVTFADDISIMEVENNNKKSAE